MSPIQSAFPGFQIGSVHLTFFGLIVLTAVAAGSVSVWRSISSPKISIDVVVDLVAVTLATSLLFGRTAYVLSPPPSVASFYSAEWYLSHVSDLLVGPLALWSGGIDSGGLLLGALLGARFVIWRRDLPFTRWADALSTGLLIFLAIAPLANLANSQQIGPPTDLPWGIPLDYRVAPYDDLSAYPLTVRFHPTPAYVAIWSVMVFVLTTVVGRPFGTHSTAIRTYHVRGLLLLPGLFAADFLRIDTSHPLLGLTLLQIVTATLWLGLAAKSVITCRASLNDNQRLTNNS